MKPQWERKTQLTELPIYAKLLIFDNSSNITGQNEKYIW